MLFGSITYEIVRRAGNVAVHVVTGDEKLAPTAQAIDTRPAAAAFDPQPYLMSVALVGLAIGCGEVLARFLNVQNVALVFLTAVLVSAVAFGLRAALFVSLLSVLAFNLFFLPPYYSITISDPENVVALFFFLVVAVIASNLTANVRAQAMMARKRARTTEDLYLFSRKARERIRLDGGGYPPRPSARPGAARRGCRRRGSHHGIEVGTTTSAGRCF